jgi:hypothetical protein
MGECFIFRGASGSILDGSVTAEKLAPNTIPDALGYTPGMVNPNLLDNWYFGNPVNQRGQTEYDNTAGNGDVYSIDRWKVFKGARLTVVASGITLNKSGMLQQLEPQLIAGIVGKTVTLSILHEEGLLTITETIPTPTGTAVVKQLDDGVFNLRFRIVSMENLRVDFSNLVAEDKRIIAAKLELGSVQTLAHQDANGNWVLNEIPDYGEQLTRCQRFFIPYVGPKTPGFFPGGGNQFEIFINTPVKMRAKPVVTLTYPDNVVCFEGGSKIINVTSFSHADMYETGIAITLNVGSNPGAYASGTAFGTSISLSADL